MGKILFVEKPDKLISSDPGLSWPSVRNLIQWVTVPMIVLVIAGLIAWVAAASGRLISSASGTDGDVSSSSKILDHIAPEKNVVEPDNGSSSSQSASRPTVKLYTVVSVTDGDTIKVDYEGVITPVRLIGVNTPETVDPRKPIECFGREASDYLKGLLTGRQVALEADPSQTDRDKYNRLLRYVYLDGEDINLKIISEGYGYEYTYNVPYAKQSTYKAAQSTAEANDRGLWSPGACNT